MRRPSRTGASVARQRFEKRWTQDELATHLQCQGDDISRDTVANLESGRTKHTMERLITLHKVYGIPMIRFFPPEVQLLDEKFVAQEKIRMAMKKRPARR